MVLSGYTDLESVTGAINQGAIYRFLIKSWEDDLLRAHIAEAFRRYVTTRDVGTRQLEANAKVEALSQRNQMLEMMIEQRKGDDAAPALTT